MAAKNPKRKGNAGERELRKYLHQHGLVGAARTEGSGRFGDGDIKGVPQLHIEAKRVERINLYAAYAQAEGDLGLGPEVPIVFHRRNRGNWMVFLSADDFLRRFYLPALGMQAPEENQLKLGQ